MDKQQARKLIAKTFENPFEKGRFTDFIKNLLNHIDVESSFGQRQGQYIPEKFRGFVSKYERIGKYYDGEKRIDILVVYLSRKTSIERARSRQRNFIADFLQGKFGGTHEKNAALVAFVSPGEADWRFSLVKMDHNFEKTTTGKIKAKEEFTQARRWSFLVGKNEASHTAQSRLVGILADDDHNPTLAQLEEAFNIETVSKEFFLKYRELFIRTKEALDKVVENDPKLKADFDAKSVDTVNFAKKLLGQIVFLYFLQKKGWFGVTRDGEWGTGSKHFLRELFDGKHGSYHNFFNDILEPLFYEALRIGEERKQDDYYYSRFNCKIPFLNGGLFDPIGNYDWEHTNLPNDLFSNTRKTKEGDTGDGILDVFDRYNFTVREDEPLEKEVAIDPELLGKAYEKFNAIRSDNFDEFVKALKSGKKGEENKFNKKFGVYYTPREIVHYMCQQSLINYLHMELNKAMVSFQRVGERQTSAFGNEAKMGQLDITSENRTSPKVSKEDIQILIKYGELVGEHEAAVQAKGRETRNYSYKLPESIRQNAELIDRALADITVCDPAVGSGAFPVGMMNEIVKARQVLETYIQAGKTTYEFKRECIEKSLYGVDIDPGAVEIAKLRLWLSLVVDEEDIRNIKPLPNLDYKIMCGNSLLGYPYTPRGLEKIESLKKKFFNETKPAEKNRLRKEIDGLIYSLFKDTEKSIGYKASMDFKINFSEVFHNKGGFDVVIGNPPYIQLQKNGGKLAKQFGSLKYETFARTGDIYTLFYEKGIKLLKAGGVLTFITSNKWMRAGYGEKTRAFFIKYNPLVLIDLGPGVFESATVDTNILIIQRSQNKHQLKAVTYNDKGLSIAKSLKTQGVVIEKLTKDAWFIGSKAEMALKEKIERIGKPLKYWDVKIYRGVLTGLNEAFIITTEKRDEILANCKDDEERKRTEAIIKPILRGRDIKRYYYEWAGLWVIVITAGWTNANRADEKADIFIEKTFPALMKHLNHFELKAKKRDDQGDYWWELRHCAYYPEFEKEKVVWKALSLQPAFSLVPSGFFNNDKANLLTSKKNDTKYLCALMNSKLFQFYFSSIGVSMGAGYEYKIQFVEKIPFPPITPANQSIVSQIKMLVDSILVTKKENLQADTQEQEREIDQLVYQLYGLTEEEIKIVNGSG